MAGQYCRLQAMANPTGGTVAQGAASFNTAGSQLTINHLGQHLSSTGKVSISAPGETTTFVQPSSSSVVWNQINDPNPSQILGNLNANGYVVLQNQSGFYIGGQAAISAHGLIMTTAPVPAPGSFQRRRLVVQRAAARRQNHQLRPDQHCRWRLGFLDCQ